MPFRDSKKSLEKKGKLRKGLAGILIMLSFMLLLYIPSEAMAVISQVWQVEGRQNFLEGEVKGVSINKDGSLSLAPAMTTFPVDDLFIWKVVVDEQGRVYASTGPEGKVYLWQEGKQKPTLLTDLEEPQCHALVLSKRGFLYAGASTPGKIYKIELSSGKASLLFDSKEEYIWSLAEDSRGLLYAGTGPKGRLYQIDAQGRGKLLYDSPEAHIISLFLDGSDNLYAGSEPGGIVYRINAQGEVFVLYDSSFAEVRSFALDSEANLFVAVMSKEAKGPSQGQPPSGQLMPFPSMLWNLGEFLEESMGGEAPVPFEGKAMEAGPPMPEAIKGMIFKISGPMVTPFWTPPSQDSVLTILMDDEGQLLAGTGGQEGKLYSLDPQGQETLLFQGNPKQILSLARSPKKNEPVFIGTANPANLLKMDKELAQEGTYLSKVMDTGSTSQWGKLWWSMDKPSQTHLSLSARTGNTEKPDDTWSPWSKPYYEEKGEEVTRPAARFIQFMATFKSDAPQKSTLLKEVSIAYLPTNLPPAIEAIEVEGPRERVKKMRERAMPMPLQGLWPPSFPPAAQLPPLPQPQGLFPQPFFPRPPMPFPPLPEAPRDGRLFISWRASDPNGDTLSYQLYYRGVEETLWKLLEEELFMPTYTWETEAVPDGKYLLKVVATDLPSNAQGQEHEAEKISLPKEIDNTPPEVEELKNTSQQDAITMKAKAKDRRSILHKAEYSVDSDPWQTIMPEDGLMDSLMETFVIPLEELDKGEHTFVLKVTDSAGNIGTGKKVFHAP